MRKRLRICGEWFDQYIKVNKGEDFDIIGLSYYPFWHGTLDDLSSNMNDIAVRYGKELVVAEVSMGHTTEDYAAYEKLAPGDRKGMAKKPALCEKVPFPMTKEGQRLGGRRGACIYQGGRAGRKRVGEPGPV